MSFLIMTNLLSSLEKIKRLNSKCLFITVINIKVSVRFKLHV